MVLVVLVMSVVIRVQVVVVIVCEGASGWREVGLMMVMVYLHIEDDGVKVSASSRLDSGI